MRIYIAPDKKGEIAGIKVRALSLQNRDVTNFDNVCADCVIKKLKICFEYKAEGKRIMQRSLDTRPACFGSDIENGIHLPLYYVKEKDMRFKVNKN